jgi:calcineurin-like phosphoesterase family protein
MTNTFYTSDPHFGHKRVSELRGFDNIEEHDSHLIEQWDKHVKPDDTVWILGDLCMSDLDGALHIMKFLNGKKHLIWGNHDVGSPIHKGAFKHQRQYLEVFETVQPYAKIKLNGQYVVMSHYPYLGTGADHTTEARYSQWRLPDEGLALMHGHVHNTDQLHYSDKGTPQIHVGLDAWDLAPVSINTIIKILT